jgi:hypothetical protein
MAGEVINMSDLTINIHLCKLTYLYFKTATKPYTNRWQQAKKNQKTENEQRKME